MIARPNRTAFDLSFPSWPPPTIEVRHGVKSPLGAVAIRNVSTNKTGRRGRFIKWREGEKSGMCWMRLSRFWWMYNHGSVPEGYRVIYGDGDTLNDDPHNYELATAGDVIALEHLNNPKWSEKQRARCWKSAAQSNRDRAHVDRQKRWLPTRWYPVDLRGRRVVNEPQRQQWMAYALVGVDVDASNWRGLTGMVLGWPELGRAESLALASLPGDGSGVPTTTLLQKTRALAELYGWAALENVGSLSSSLWRLRNSGFIKTRHGGRQPSLQSITPKALDARTKPCGYVVMKGSRIDRDHKDFARFNLKRAGVLD